MRSESRGALRGALYRTLQSVPAGAKLLGLIVFSTALILLQNLLWLGVIAAVMFIVWFTVRDQQAWSWRHIWPIALTFIFLFAYMTWVSGVQEGAVALCRLIALWAAAQTVMITTSTTAMMQTVETVVTPVARLCRANPARIALLFGLTIRLIPLLAQQWQEVREAQQARGVKIKIHSMLVPMLVRTLARTQALTDAIDARQLGVSFSSESVKNETVVQNKQSSGV
jgi:biotin transport system permease protein